MAKDYETTAVGVGLAMLSLPFIVFAAPAGYVADRFSKRSVIVWCKVAEIVIMAIGVFARLDGGYLFHVRRLVCDGGSERHVRSFQIRFHSGNRSGNRLSIANGWVGMTTLISIVLGTLIASQLHKVLNTSLFAKETAAGLNPAWNPENLWVPAMALIGVAAIGFVASLMIRRLPIADPSRRFPIFWPAQTYHDFQSAAKSRALLLAVFGSALFWAIAAFVPSEYRPLRRQDAHARSGRRLDPSRVPHHRCRHRQRGGGLSFRQEDRIGTRSDRYSRHGRRRLHSEHLPAGRNGHVGNAVQRRPGSPFLLGVFGGCYDIPIQAFIQYRSPESTRGGVLAAANFATFVGTLAISLLFPLLGDWLKLTGPNVFLLSESACFRLPCSCSTSSANTS